MKFIPLPEPSISRVPTCRIRPLISPYGMVYNANMIMHHNANIFLRSERVLVEDGVQAGELLDGGRYPQRRPLRAHLRVSPTSAACRSHTSDPQYAPINTLSWRAEGHKTGALHTGRVSRHVGRIRGGVHLLHALGLPRNPRHGEREELRTHATRVRQDTARTAAMPTVRALREWPSQRIREV